MHLNNEGDKVGGRLTHFREAWIASPWALGVVSQGLGWRWSRKSPFKRKRPFLQPRSAELDEYVSKMLSKDTIERCHFLAFQGRLFSVPKKDSSERRIILDLSALNKSIPCPKFKMTTIAQIRSSLPKGGVTCSLDLRDAYWHVPINPRFRPYLGFRLGRKSYRFKVMPFGLNIAPRVFTKLTKVIIKELRLAGILIWAYLDDVDLG